MFVSNYRREIAVPFEDVVRVSASRFTSPPVIRLDLRRDLGFGRQIVFAPPERWGLPRTPHPLARELARIVGHPEPSRGAGGGG